MNTLHPVAQCLNPKCAVVFPVTAIVINNSQSVTFSNFHTNCQSCGGDAKILDGTFDFMGDTMRLLSGPQATIDALKQVAQIIRYSVAAGETAEKTLDRVAEIAPWLSGLKKMAKSQAVNLLWTALGMIASYEYTQYRDGMNATQKREEQVQIYLEGARRDRDVQQWNEFQARMKEPLPTPPPVTAPQRPRFGLSANPAPSEFPGTLAKLAEYAKQNRQRNK